MPRPHEDLAHHTLVDHVPGGSKIAFPADAWCAIEVASVAADRTLAGISTYETLIEKARTSSAKARAAAVFRSANGRRVIALIQVDGHDCFRHLQSAWDDQHLEAERHAVAESRTLALYRLGARTGDVFVAPSTKDTYAFERVALNPAAVGALLAPIVAAAGFVGVQIFGTDDATASAILYRFEHAEAIANFRASSEATSVLGDAGASGESFYVVHPVKTFH